MTKSIPTLMLEDHKRILGFLNEFEKQIAKDTRKAKEIFEKFKWNLEKHFFVEEKVIFTIFDTRGEGEQEDILNLLKEHKDIFLLMKKAEDSLSKNTKPDVSELKTILLRHADFEGENFYPRLEEELSEQEKSLITQRAKQIVGE